jgi:hypothetical protein
MKTMDSYSFFAAENLAMMPWIWFQKHTISRKFQPRIYNFIYIYIYIKQIRGDILFFYIYRRDSKWGYLFIYFYFSGGKKMGINYVTNLSVRGFFFSTNKTMLSIFGKIIMWSSLLTWRRDSFYFYIFF